MGPGRVELSNTLRPLRASSPADSTLCIVKALILLAADSSNGTWMNEKQAFTGGVTAKEPLK